MADYITCVKESGGNSERITLEVKNANNGSTGVGVKGSGSGVVAKGSGAVTVDHATEQALASKFEQIWGSRSMEECRKALDPPRPSRPKEPNSSKPTSEHNSTVSALTEVRTAIQAMEKLIRDWGQEVRQAHTRVERAQTRLTSASEDARAQAQEDLDKAKDAYGIALAGINGRLDQASLPVISQMNQAVAHAIARMKMPGRKQISPNEASEIEYEYHRTLASIKGPITPQDYRDNRVDLDTFDPVIKFLKNLSEKLADYPENPTGNG